MGQCYLCREVQRRPLRLLKEQGETGIIWGRATQAQGMEAGGRPTGRFLLEKQGEQKVEAESERRLRLSPGRMQLPFTEM